MSESYSGPECDDLRQHTTQEHHVGVEAAVERTRIVDKMTPISDQTIYEETAKVTAIFWEWRHKTMTRFFGVIGGVIAVNAWLYQHSQGLRSWHSIPLLAGATYSLVSYLLDIRHTKIFTECYRIAADIELRARQEGAIYNFINKLHYTRGSLTQILHTMYIISAILLLALFVTVATLF